MKSWKVRLTVVLTMLTMLAAISNPAMAQSAEDQIQQIYKGSVIGCNTKVADGLIGQEEFDQCVEEDYLTNLASLLQGLEATGRLTDEVEGVLDGLQTTSEQMT